MTKSRGLLLGTWASCQSLPVALDWFSHSITMMGAKLMNELDDSNWSAPLVELKQTLDIWRQRRLSYHGRALVLNSLGLSIFWYLASFLTMSSTVKTAINSTAFSFLWNGKRERVARSSLTQPSSSGGLNVVDLNLKLDAFHVIWVRHLGQSPDHPSFFFFSCALRVAFAGRSLQQILLLPAPSQTAMNLLPPFFRSAMSAWFRLSRRLENATSSSMALVPWSRWRPCLSVSRTGSFHVWLVRIIVAWRSSVCGACLSSGPAFGPTSTSGPLFVPSEIPTGSSPMVCFQPPIA